MHVREALAQGTQLEKAVASLRETHNHERVVAGVLAGEADAGFIRSDLIEAMIADGKLQAGALKVIDARTTPAYPYLHSTRLYPDLAVRPRRRLSRGHHQGCSDRPARHEAR